MDDLPHPLGLDQVAQPVDAGVGQLDAGTALEVERSSAAVTSDTTIWPPLASP